MSVNPYLINSLELSIHNQFNLLYGLGNQPLTTPDRRSIVPGYTMQNEWGFYVFHHLLEDLYGMLTLLKSYVYGPYAPMMGTGRPMLCIARSALERYADVLNFNTLTAEHGGESRFIAYSEYLNFLKRESEDKGYRQTEEHRETSTRLCRMLGLRGSYVNRKSRYYVAGRAHFSYLPYQEKMVLSDFNRKLSSLDSDFSGKIHGNVLNEPENLNETMTMIYYLISVMSVGAYVNFMEYERLPVSINTPTLSNFLPITNNFISLQ